MKKNILYFFPENPFSNRAGNVARAFSTLKILNKIGCSVDLVGSKDVYQMMGDNEEFDHSLVNTLTLISRKPTTKKTSPQYWKYKVEKMFSKKNDNIFLSPNAIADFAMIVSAKKYDAIIINYEVWAQLINNEACKNIFKIVDTHDWITLNEFYKNKNYDIGKRFGEEINNLNLFDKVVTISSDEYFVFKSFLEDKVANIPPTFPSHFAKDQDQNPNKKYDLIFVGSESIFNVTAIKWFIDKVLPLLASEIKILIIGRVCNQIQDHPQIEKIKFVEDLSRYYDSSKIVLCPMLHGTGIKIKVVEALSYGLPVVGTPKAIDGFPEKTNNGCIITEHPNTFASAITSILEDQNLYDIKQKEAKTYFEAHFSEEFGVRAWKGVLG